MQREVFKIHFWWARECVYACGVDSSWISRVTAGLTTHARSRRHTCQSSCLVKHCARTHYMYGRHTSSNMWCVMCARVRWNSNNIPHEILRRLSLKTYTLCVCIYIVCSIARSGWQPIRPNVKMVLPSQLHSGISPLHTQTRAPSTCALSLRVCALTRFVRKQNRSVILWASHIARARTRAQAAVFHRVPTHKRQAFTRGRASKESWLTRASRTANICALTKKITCKNAKPLFANTGHGVRARGVRVSSRDGPKKCSRHAWRDAHHRTAPVCVYVYYSICL